MELFWENKKTEVLFMLISVNITLAIRENMPICIKNHIYTCLHHDETNITMAISLLSFLTAMGIYIFINIILNYKKISDKIPFFSSVISQQKAWANSKQIKEDKSNKSEE